MNTHAIVVYDPEGGVTHVAATNHTDVLFHMDAVLRTARMDDAAPDWTWEFTPMTPQLRSWYEELSTPFDLRGVASL